MTDIRGEFEAEWSQLKLALFKRQQQNFDK
jgi:hypothetical protein